MAAGEVAAAEEPIGVAPPGDVGDQLQEGRVGPVLRAAGAVVLEIGAGGRQLGVLARVGVAVDVGEDDRADARQELEDLGAVRAELGVDEDGRAGPPVRLGRRVEHAPLERAQAVVARADLDRARALADVGDEALDEVERAHGVVRAVVRLAMDTGRRDDVEAGRARHGAQPLEVAAEADRRPVDVGRRAGSGERRDLLDRPVEVVELLSVQER